MEADKKPVRILLLFTIMNRGGAETMVMNYYRNIDRSKIQFDFMVHRQKRGDFEDEIESLGGRIYRMCAISPQNLYTYKELLRNFFYQHTEYKIIHSHMSELGYYAFKEAQKHDISVRICHAHNTPVFSMMGWTEKGKAIGRWYLKKKIIQISTHLFACSQESANWLYGIEKNKEFIILKNAIEVAKFQFNINTRERLKKELNLEDKLVIGHIGRFEEQKNHLFLIDIFKEIQKTNPKSVLMLVGDGYLKTKVKDKVRQLGLKDKVQFLGVREDVNDLLQVMDAFVLPSLFEGLAMVLIEAQASGLKCFTSKDVVTEKANVTNLLQYISLDDRADSWAKKILDSNLNEKRTELYKIVINNKWDIHSNVDWLTDFYLNCRSNSEC